jgi:hypothetical protein
VLLILEPMVVREEMQVSKWVVRVVSTVVEVVVLVVEEDEETAATAAEEAEATAEEMSEAETETAVRGREEEGALEVDAATEVEEAASEDEDALQDEEEAEEAAEDLTTSVEEEEDLKAEEEDLILEDVAAVDAVILCECEAVDDLTAGEVHLTADEVFAAMAEEEIVSSDPDSATQLSLFANTLPSTASALLL